MARALFLAASIASISGCGIGAADPQLTALNADDQPPNVRYQIDPERHRAWFLTHEGLFVHDVSRPERVSVSLPDWAWVNAAYACPPDLALGPKGEALVTSNSVPTLWRIDPDTFVVSVHPLGLDADTDKDVGFSALTYSPQHGAFLAASYSHGSLWRIDPSFEQAHKVSLSAPIPEACGLAVRPRSAQPALSRQADLCVHTLRGGRSVIFASSWGSAHVSAAPCTDHLATAHAIPRRSQLHGSLR